MNKEEFTKRVDQIIDESRDQAVADERSGPVEARQLQEILDATRLRLIEELFPPSNVAIGDQVNAKSMALQLAWFVRETAKLGGVDEETLAAAERIIELGKGAPSNFIAKTVLEAAERHLFSSDTR